MSEQHTKEPWRWEINAKHKTAQIVGGVPAFDLTVMDFERWGMGGAVPRFRDTAHDGMNIMHRLCDRPDWIAPFQGRDHHADWCANVIHPDARRIVLAVNAVAGFTDDELADLQGVHDAVIKQRDQFLETLESLIMSANDSDAACYGTLSTSFVREMCEQAIASVKGIDS